MKMTALILSIVANLLLVFAWLRAVKKRDHYRALWQEYHQCLKSIKQYLHKGAP